MTQRISVLLSPVVTPFKADLSPDTARFVRQCKWLVANKVGLAVFGTNSEANSLAAGERMELLEKLVEAGVEPARMMPGTGCCALTDSVRLTAHAVKLGCAGALMLPPFYYKGVSDEGLYRNYAEIVERVGDARLRIYLYHIPQVTQVPISLALIERLLKAYPKNIAGTKDSSGDWNNTKATLDQFAKDGFDVFPGSETFLLAGLRNGGKGCISAANVNRRRYRSTQTGLGRGETAGGPGPVRLISRSTDDPAMKRAVALWAATRLGASARRAGDRRGGSRRR